MKRTILTTVALLGAAAAWLSPTASAAAGHTHHDGATAAAHRAGPAPSATFTCPASTRCNDTSWGG
ncbi:hypothetical protein [Kitasatospora sp. NPDC097691]|uniref:hypothetical protein n=1 Tax=Kitasatospora sp. NPDC097691 TaxID=3157231 RepID=UPI00332A4982